MKKPSKTAQIKSLTKQVESLTQTVQNQNQVIAAAENASYGDGVPLEGPASNSMTVSRIAEQVQYLTTSRENLSEQVDRARAQVQQTKDEAVKVFGVLASQATTAIKEATEAAQANATAAQRRDIMVQAFVDLTNKAPLTEREQAIFRAGFVTSSIDDSDSAKAASEVQVVPAKISGKQPQGSIGGIGELIAALAGHGGPGMPRLGADFGDEDQGFNPFGR